MKILNIKEFPLIVAVLNAHVDIFSMLLTPFQTKTLQKNFKTESGRNVKNASKNPFFL